MLMVTLVLAGCAGLNAVVKMDLTIDKDLRVSGGLVATVERQKVNEKVSELGGLAQESDIEKQLDQSVEDVKDTIPEGAQAEKISTDSELGYRVTFDKVAAEDFTSTTGSGPGRIVLKKDGDNIVMELPNIAKDTDSPAFNTGGEAPSTSEIFKEAEVKLTFPGKVVEAEGGQISGKTVTYDLRSYDKDVISVTAKASGFPWLIVFIVIGLFVFLAIVAAVVILVVVVAKKKQKNQPPAPFGQGGPNYPVQQPGAAPYNNPGPQAPQAPPERPGGPPMPPRPPQS